MFAKDVMTTNVISVHPELPVFEVARLLAERGISGVPVIGEDGAIAGMVSEGDLVHELTSGRGPKRSWWLELIGGRDRTGGQEGAGKTAEDVMSRDVICADYFATIPTIAALLEKHHIKRVPVIDHGKVVGIVSRANLVQYLASHRPDAGGEMAAKDQQIRARLMAEITVPDLTG